MTDSTSDFPASASASASVKGSVRREHLVVGRQDAELDDPDALLSEEERTEIVSYIPPSI